jgi:uracil-DNA glycosylase
MSSFTMEQYAYILEQIDIGTDELYFEEPFDLQDLEHASTAIAKASGSVLPNGASDAIHSSTAAIPTTTTTTTATTATTGNGNGNVAMNMDNSANSPQASNTNVAPPYQQPNVNSALFKAAPLATIPFDQAGTLEALHDLMRNIPAYQKGKEFQWGLGVANCKLAIIGYTPTQQDIDLGTPWSGESGELLRKMLQAIDIEFNNCYKTWFIKQCIHRVLPRQIELFKQGILQEISLLCPSAVLVMGEKAVQALSGDGSPLDQRVRTWNMASVTCYGTYDAAELIQQPALKRLAWAHLQALQAYLQRD